MVQLVPKHVKRFVVKEHTPVTEPTFDAFFELIDNIVSHCCGYENELYLNGLQHVEDLVEQNLLRSLDVVFNVFENEQDECFRVLLKPFLNLRYHLDRVKLFVLLAGHSQCFAELLENFRLTVVKNRVYSHHFQSLFGVKLGHFLSYILLYLRGERVQRMLTPSTQQHRINLLTLISLLQRAHHILVRPRIEESNSVAHEISEFGDCVAKSFTDGVPIDWIMDCARFYSLALLQYHCFATLGPLLYIFFGDHLRV